MLLVCDTRYRDNDFEVRYLLLCGVPLLILLALQGQALVRGAPARLAAAGRLGTAAGALCLLTAADLFAWKETRPAALADTDQAKAIRMADYVRQQPLAVERVYIQGLPGYAEVARVTDGERFYIAFHPQEGRLEQYDYYLTAQDAAAQDGQALVALTAGTDPSGLPVYLREALTWYDSMDEWNFYLANDLPLDGVVGLPAGDKMVDYPDSPAYTCVGEVDSRRRLHAVGEADVPWVIRSPTLPLAGWTDITLDCAGLQGEGGELELWQGETRLTAVPLQQGPVSISGVAAGDYILKVSLPEGCSATLGPITFAKSGA